CTRTMYSSGWYGYYW
nr:immunoglobulin heavy chain junction region [Macaca mulatta]MPN83845.1 immunoglobulin heavy chain junction region [Macaca mulatta]MPN84054.1 immunoglobulin heavy chain junction region [Macaca mulatta]MPN84108.1 immunoglobulin heavy chain junction region [Macaca mulatta]MPN84270.1 immunoglobulin heavy chain junction region [Macaca mulatta]